MIVMMIILWSNSAKTPIPFHFPNQESELFLKEIEYADHAWISIVIIYYKLIRYILYFKHFQLLLFILSVCHIETP